MTDATPFLPGLSPVARESLTATQDAGNLTSNGGLVVLREAARRLGLAAVIADPLPDTRNQLLVIHSYRAMVTARMMAILAEEARTALCREASIGRATEPRLAGSRGSRP